MDFSELYYTPGERSSFMGPYALYKHAKSKGMDVRLKDVKEWLTKQESYTMNRAVKKPFRQNTVPIHEMDYMWDTDLGDMGSLSAQNDKHHYILLCIDIFSRYVWGRPLKTKRAKDVVEAFGSIVEEGRKPKTLRSDAGSEYTNKVIQNFLKNKGIHHYVTHNTTQASYAERVLKTIKTKLYRYMVSNYTSRYINVLQDIINSYNATVHRSLGRAPKDVSPGNQAEVRTEQYVIKNKPKKYNRDRTIRKPLRYTFSIDDKVRISTRREAFSREYSTRFTGEIFTIYIRYKRDGIPVYKVTDWSGEKVEGAFYEAELQKVTVDQNTRYRIEKIIKRRKHRGEKQALVRWLNWPARFDSWIPERELINYGPV